ncbi:hypothetical protein [Tahibacter amnicola]|uniref:PAS domain-containing protein n=1 Tax=Tahibacter amnicola TaxID=2976241 RepID=A0ABY6BJT1_9GAMM|nr:hypothetical protein [Tahibacter amnicola]UXI70279.1 hypothetical protein N4264_11780 [Tahibacter amnicola]
MPRSDETPVRKWLDLIKDDPAVVIDAGDVLREANDNLWCFSPIDDEIQAVSTTTVTTFITDVAALRRQQLQAGAMWFYCWHDGQARQLRMSLISRSHGRLPFARSITMTDDASEIARHAVEEDWRDAADHDAAPDIDIETPDLPLRVFVADVP